MSNGSRYGLDLGNILARSSTIKTARARQEREELLLEKEKAPIKLQENILAKKEKKEFEEYSDLETDGEYPSSMIKTLSPEEETRANILAPEVAQQTKKTQQIESLTNYYMKKGQSKEEAKLRATGYSDDIDNFDKEYRTKTEFEQEQIRNSISQQGQRIQNLMQVAQKDPQQAEAMYQDYIKDQNEKIKGFLKDGQTEIADKIQESLDKAPPTLLKTDGSFDAEFPMLSLSKMSTMMQNAETYDVQKKSDIKVAEKERMPDTKSGEFERLMKQLKNPNISEEDKALVNRRLTKLTQSDMSSLKINAETVKDYQTAFADKLNLDSPYKLATIDTRELSEEDQAQANQTASIIVKGLGANAKVAEKKMGEFGAAQDQMQNALAAYEQVGDFRAADEFTKKYFSNYFGLSEEELKSSEAASAFQSLLNIKIKADSGSAVSGQEMVRNTLETASPYMTKDKIKLGIKNVAKRYIGELKSLKRVMGPVAFNLKYGAVLSNYEDIAKAVDAVKETKGDDITRLRQSRPKQDRQSMYQQISTQRPNATPEQINAYLNSKGY